MHSLKLGGVMRALRRYRYVAQVEHWSDRCFEWIQPGDYYEGIVYISNGKLWILKQHIEPMCDYPPDPFDDEENNESNFSENEFLNAA